MEGIDRERNMSERKEGTRKGKETKGQIKEMRGSKWKGKEHERNDREI